MHLLARLEGRESAVWRDGGEVSERPRLAAERGLAPAPVGSCGGLAAPPSELICRRDTSTVVGMDNTQKIKPRDLVVGRRYLHRNGLFIRQITEINGNTVGYLDEGKDRWCREFHSKGNWLL